ncbi:hypothetical protein EDD11_007865 [Mortierella claussenii]|nr:hypothetical protein EDD11_007865 [Mortierella claussenii]
MDSLPVEAFQLVCTFCSLHTLASLRLVSKAFRDRVDGSLTARRSHAAPKGIILPKGAHDRTACYVRITLNRQHQPITAVFDRYDPDHNYLEFKQLSDGAEICRSGFTTTSIATAPPEEEEVAAAADISTGTAVHAPTDAGGFVSAYLHQDFTLGRLDLNLWEQQQDSVASIASSSSSSPSSSTAVNNELSGQAQPTGPRTRRRLSITQAGIIRGTEQEIENELASSGPITPLSQTRPVRHAMTSALSGSLTASSSPATAPGGLPRDSPVQGDNYMMRFARMILGSTGVGPQLAQTRPGMTAAELVEEARQLIHTVEPEVLSSKKQYKVWLSEGAHFIGDNDFILRYTVSKGSSPSLLLFKVDYIRVSWRWIMSGVPISIKAKQAGVRLSVDGMDPMTLQDPFPEQRMGRIYAERFNRLLQEIKRKEVSRHIRGELALMGYDASVLPREFISINLNSGPVLAWITRSVQAGQRKAAKKSEGKEVEKETLRSGHDHTTRNDGASDSEPEWEDILPQYTSGRGKGKVADTEAGIVRSSASGEQHDHGQDDGDQCDEDEAKRDQEALNSLLQDLKDNMGYLTARNVVEEMLACQGYSRELIWKYGIVRREMMGTVPEVKQAKQWVQKIVYSEAAGQGAKKE